MKSTEQTRLGRDFFVDLVKLIDEAQWITAILYLGSTALIGPILALIGWKCTSMILAP